MKRLIRSFFSQKFINNVYHLPLAFLANIFYGFPTRGMKVIGVTGTDGKTTTVNMIYQVLKAVGKKVSMVSTINAYVAGKSYDTGFHVTSPDPFMLQKFAKESLDNEDEYLVLEVTSHALDQFRFWGIKFEIGVITNITHEHLDYHKTFENYFNTKLKLIRGVKVVVINQVVWDNWQDKGNMANRVTTFGLDKGDFNQKDLKLKLKIPGDYNIENALAALAVAFSLNVDRKVAQRILERFAGISGRMQEVKNNKGIKIIVDFAHTPNGLGQALKTLRKQSKGRLIAVFGSAGKRDIEKRALMGEIAGKLADIIVVTAEDPRGELENISRQIATGAKKTGAKLDRNLFLIRDRQQAINVTINQLAKKGDILGIFGKGHESSMNMNGKKELPWSDREAVEKVLKGDRGDEKRYG